MEFKEPMQKQAVIIGGGPSGTLMALLLHQAGLDVIVLERQSRSYVLSRIRAGVLEWNTVQLLRKSGVGKRMDKLGHVHTGTFLSSSNKQFRIDFKDLVNTQVMVYGQTEVTADLYDKLELENIEVLHNVKDIKISDLQDRVSSVVFKNSKGENITIKTDFVIGCDGFHGVSRNYIPANVLKVYEKIYPFGWLGILSETPPVSSELIYASHQRGFALASMRNKMLSRYYIQVSNDDHIKNWSDKDFWNELKLRLPTEAADNIVTGSSIEKSIAPLRSYVAEPMKWGNLFLVGDAAHIVPPTGAKGLNLAFSDVNYLSKAIIEFYSKKNNQLINNYSEKALSRVWKGIRFSWWMTTLMHNFPQQSEFERKIQVSELDYLSNSSSAQKTFAENYVGLPY